MKKRIINVVNNNCNNQESSKKPHKLMSPNEIIDPQSFARSYQLDALEKAMQQNTIVYLETGSGKTLIAIMLIRAYAYQLRKPSPFIAVFMVPTVHLVKQQAGVVSMHTDLKVGKYWGEMGVDFWDANTWKDEIDSHEVLVMTPRILLDALRHGFFKLDIINLLIFDECHNAKGNSDYACILKEFYHPQLYSTPTRLPRIFGMTACIIKSKGEKSPEAYAKKILEFENLLNSKVFTVENESVLAEFIPISTPKLKLYKRIDLPKALALRLENELVKLRTRYVQKLKNASEDSSVKKILRLCQTFLFCMKDLGVWSACQASKALSCTETDVYFWGPKDGGVSGKNVRSFSAAFLDVISGYIPSGSNWCIGNDLNANLDAGLLTSRVNCLIESLMEYREAKHLRCIIFVERVITAIVLQSLLSEVMLPNGWSVTYMAGNRAGLNIQKRNEQFNIIDAFRNGAVNIIVATEILEEGLDVQSCNLVIRFDPSKTVCSFIQSRGRARMEGSDYLLIIPSGDASEFSRVNSYLASGEIMREESLRYSSFPCAPRKSEMHDEEFYHVETTGALVSLSSSVATIYYYCSQLPSDGYFNPTPRFIFDEESKVCTLHLPKSCPLETVCVQGPKDILKKLVCLEACKKLHEIGALNDNLIPEFVEDDTNANDLGDISYEEQESYYPGELVFNWPSHIEEIYHYYTIEMQQNFDDDVSFENIILAVKSNLGNDFTHMDFELFANKGSVGVNVVYAGTILLSPERVSVATKFQVALLRLLINQKWNRFADALDKHQQNDTVPRISYLLLPSTNADGKSPTIHWDCISSLFTLNWHRSHCPEKSCLNYVHTEDKEICRGMLMNSLVVTPHNGYVYCISGSLDGLDGNSVMKSKGEALRYKEYYQSKHGIKLRHEGQTLLRGRHVFTVQNCLRRQSNPKEKESTAAYVELPPELCKIIMSCISLGTLKSYSLVPSIMHRIESIVLALHLKKLQTGHLISNIQIPTMKILEAITTKKCQEEFSLESLETLGDSFLKYAVSQQLFKRNKNHHEGLLSGHRERMVSNSALCKLGCKRKLQGFVRYECFDPKCWVVPGDLELSGLVEASFSTSGQLYVTGSRHMKTKVIADVVEGLIGAYLTAGGEPAALHFLDWLGLKVDFSEEISNGVQFTMQPERHINVVELESLLDYRFRDHSLLLEALTHGSYQLSGISRCYQRLEFLGDSVLDFLITSYMYNLYPGMSPGQLTDLRSSAVNNDCYAFAAVKAELHKHILHASPLLHEQIKNFIKSFGKLSLQSTNGWESETNVPKVLGDIIESLAGAILVDSGYSIETVWNCIRPILEPLATLDTMKFNFVPRTGILATMWKTPIDVTCQFYLETSVLLLLEYSCLWLWSYMLLAL